MPAQSMTSFMAKYHPTQMNHVTASSWVSRELWLQLLNNFCMALTVEQMAKTNRHANQLISFTQVFYINKKRLTQVCKDKSSKWFSSPFPFSSLKLGLHPVELFFPLFQKRIMHNIVIRIILTRHVILHDVSREKLGPMSMDTKSNQSK